MDETPQGVLRNQPERAMQKLIQRFRNNPTDANARAVLAYDIKHPFATVLLPMEDQLLVAKLLALDSVGGL
jgi:hypothetical protein